MHSCGNAAIKGCSWPNVWVNAASFSLVEFSCRSDRDSTVAAPLAPVKVLSRTTVFVTKLLSNSASVSLMQNAARPMLSLVYQPPPPPQSKYEFRTISPNSSPLDSDTPNFVAESVMKAPEHLRHPGGSLVAA